MQLLLTQMEVYKKLIKNNIVTFKRESFVKAINKGKIPYTFEEGRPVKLYIYDDVVKALKKAGLGRPPNKEVIKAKKAKRLKEKLDKAPEPKPNQTKEEYGASIASELGEEPTLTDANIYKQIYSGKLEKLKYEQQMGELISKTEVEDKAFTVARSIRDKIISIPERMANELASIDNPHIIKELLYKEFNVLLEGFSKESFYVE